MKHPVLACSKCKSSTWRHQIYELIWYIFTNCLHTHCHARQELLNVTSTYQARACTNTPNYNFNMREVDYSSWEYGNYTSLEMWSSRAVQWTNKMEWVTHYNNGTHTQKNNMERKKCGVSSYEFEICLIVDGVLTNWMEITFELRKMCERVNSERSHRMSSKWHSKRTKAGCQVVLVMILCKLNMSLLRP